MKRHFLKATAFFGSAIIIISAYISGLHAQQSTPAKPPATTNWIGCLVVGQNDPTDRIAVGGPHPTVARKVEIGLRSDGVVMWRSASINK